MIPIKHAWLKFICRWFGHRLDAKSRQIKPCDRCSRCGLVDSLGLMLMGLELYEFDEAEEAPR